MSSVCIGLVLCLGIARMGQFDVIFQKVLMFSIMRSAFMQYEALVSMCVSRLMYYVLHVRFAY